MISRAGVLQQLPQAFIQIELACREIEPRALCFPGIDLLVQSHGLCSECHTILQFILRAAHLSLDGNSASRMGVTNDPGAHTKSCLNGGLPYGPGQAGAQTHVSLGPLGNGVKPARHRVASFWNMTGNPAKDSVYATPECGFSSKLKSRASASATIGRRRAGYQRMLGEA